jgi:hypothetical protein
MTNKIEKLNAEIVNAIIDEKRFLRVNVSPSFHTVDELSALKQICDKIDELIDKHNKMFPDTMAEYYGEEITRRKNV